MNNIEKFPINNKKKFPEDLTRSWEGIPDFYKSVYHSTKYPNIENISKYGILPYEELDANEIGGENFTDKETARMELRKITDKIIDGRAKDNGFSILRSNSFYCSPYDSGNWNESDVKLELKVDPKKANVFDSDIATGATMAWFRTTEGKKWLGENEGIMSREEKGKLLELLKDQAYYPKSVQEYADDYWKTSMTLDRFMDEKNKEGKFKSPEILMSGKIDRKYVRIATNND